jgi:hypothetical protein
MTAGTQKPTELTKRSYQPPSLQGYGAMRDLTAGGTGNAQEPGAGGARPRP